MALVAHGLDNSAGGTVDDAARADPPGVLHRPADNQKNARPRTICRLPRHDAAAAHVRDRDDRHPAQSTGYRAARRAADRSVPEPPRARAWQQPPDPQRTARRDPLALPLRGAAPSRARRHDRPRDRDPDQTPPTNAIVSYLDRDRRSTRCSKRPTGPPGSDGATMRCCSPRSRPGCASQNSCGLDRSLPVARRRRAAYRSWGNAASSAVAALTCRPSRSSRLAARARRRARDPLFPTRRGGPLSPKAFAMLLDKHTATAVQACPSLQAKRITPHTLRHTNAMLLRAEKSTSTPSRCGSGMRARNRPRSIFTPTTRSNSKRSTGPRRRAPHPAATSHPTDSSRSSNVCSCLTQSAQPAAECLRSYWTDARPLAVGCGQPLTPTTPTPAVSGSRGGCPPRLPQNRTYAGRIRLFGTAGYDPRRRPVCRPRIIPIAPVAA